MSNRNDSSTASSHGRKRCVFYFLLALATFLAISCSAPVAPPPPLFPDFQPASSLEEQSAWFQFDPGIRILINAPAPALFDAAKPTVMVLYALPNGNTIEQTVGAAMAEGMDWHFDIQHIAAQTRMLRQADESRNWVVVYLEAEGRSWPSWVRKQENAGPILLACIDALRARFASTQAEPPRVILTGHSGGGAFDFAVVAAAPIPAWVEAIAFLDSNYAYSEEKGHGARLVEWLRGNQHTRLAVLAYDDRRIEIERKPVLKNPDNGTYGSTLRMLARTEGEFPATESVLGEFRVWRALDGRIDMRIHPNPQNKILHTVMIGEMNGYLHVLTTGTPLENQVATLGPPRVYGPFVDPAPLVRPEPLPPLAP